MSFNKITILGYVLSKPRVTTFDNGNKVLNMTVTTHEKGYTAKDGREIPPHTEYHNIVVHKLHIVNYVEKYADKEQRIYVEGYVRSRKYGDPEMGRQTIYEIIAERIEMIDYDRIDVVTRTT